MAKLESQIWRVGAIMREPLEVVLRFCAWYLELGADEVVVFLDDPDDPVTELLAGQSRVRLIPCTREFWSSIGMSPDAPFVKRQNAAMTSLYQSYDTGWLLNVDADELLYFTSGEMGALLERIPEQALSARVQTAERLRVIDAQPGQVHFRLPMAYQLRKDIYAEDAPLFGPRREGFVGHSQGKSIIRCGEPGLRLRQHWPRWGWQGEPREVVYGAGDGVVLLHLIGEDYDIWRGKLAWRCASRGFTAPLTDRIEALLKTGAGEDQLRDVFERLHGATKERLERMRAGGALLEVSLELDELTKRHLPSVMV